MHLQFQGAARTVTGSMHMVAVNGQTILLDCGIFHGRRQAAYERNSTFPFDPASIKAVVLSHAHIDHSGNLPTLVRQGFKGAIYATRATKSLCEVMLKDSAYIQERDAEFVNKRHKKKGIPMVVPLYTQGDADAAMALFQGMKYRETFDVIDGVEARFEDAGHILGSASVALTLRENSSTVHLSFTGDLGRPNLPILRDPVFIDPDRNSTYVISESTYGGRFHKPVRDMADQLLGPLQRACEQRSKIVIPAFSVGRTQEIVYVLHQLAGEGKIDNLPVFVDSPLSVNVTDVFKRHPECYDDETREILHSAENNDPFGFESLTYIRDVEQSKELNDREGPFVVIAASGMCEAGRVVHHLSNTVKDPENIILIVGYQAEHTLGRKLVMKEPMVNILGEPHELKAEVTVLNSFSGHADRNELLDYARGFSTAKTKGMFLVHGDVDQSEKLSVGMSELGFRNVIVPERGQKVDLLG